MHSTEITLLFLLSYIDNIWYIEFKMSWLFGLNNKGNIGEAPQVPVLGDDSGSGDDNKNPVSAIQDNQNADTGYRSDAYSFDSTALERAAKAAKV